MSLIGTTRTFRNVRCSVASLIGRLGSSVFRRSDRCSVDVAHGLVLLFGIGTKALPSWDSKTRWNNLWGGLAVRRTAGPSDRTNSPHPSSREGHRSTARWSSSFLRLHLILYSRHAVAACRVHRNSVPLDRYAVHDHSQPACQGHDRLHPAAPGDLDRPGFEPGPFLDRSML